MTAKRCFIGLGSNLAAPASQVKQALNALSEIAGIRLITCSGLWKSRPMGPADQPDFINAVAEIETSLTAEELLDRCQQIEHAQNRVRDRHWGPRTIDLDILTFGDNVVDTERLKIPHPGICERNFVLFPLQEIAPGYLLKGQPLTKWLKNTDTSSISRYDCKS